MRVPVCQRPYMELEASKTIKIRVSGSGFASGGGSTPCARALRLPAIKRSAKSPLRSMRTGLVVAQCFWALRQGAGQFVVVGRDAMPFVGSGHKVDPVAHGRLHD